MGTKMEERHLEQAEEHVITGVRLIRQQRDLASELEVSGNAARPARKLLKTFEQLHDAQLKQRDQLRKNLNRVGDVKRPAHRGDR